MLEHIASRAVYFVGFAIIADLALNYRKMGKHTRCARIAQLLVTLFVVVETILERE